MIAVVESPAIAAATSCDFEQLWTTGDVMKTGFVEPRWDDGVRAWFTPGHGDDLSHRIAKVDPPRPPARSDLLAGAHDRGPCSGRSRR